MNDINDNLSRIAEALENIHEQLEIINSPKADKEFNRWYYDRKQRIELKERLINHYKEDTVKVAQLKEDLKHILAEKFEG